MSGIRFLQKSILIALLWSVSSFVIGSEHERPNILWITIEDTSPHFIGCYGNSDARTPNIDKLANEGVRFSNTFATGAVCSSSRSTIITGMYTGHLGTGNHRSKYKISDGWLIVLGKAMLIIFVRILNITR